MNAFIILSFYNSIMQSFIHTFCKYFKKLNFFFALQKGELLWGIKQTVHF
jgi:hypothetical protein